MINYWKKQLLTKSLKNWIQVESKFCFLESIVHPQFIQEPNCCWKKIILSITILKNFGSRLLTMSTFFQIDFSLFFLVDDFTGIDFCLFQVTGFLSFQSTCPINVGEYNMWSLFFCITLLIIMNSIIDW